jgi:hypothetical protein
VWRRQREIARTHPPRPHPNASKALILLELSASSSLKGCEASNAQTNISLLPSPSVGQPWDSVPQK